MGLDVRHDPFPDDLGGRTMLAADLHIDRDRLARCCRRYGVVRGNACEAPAWADGTITFHGKGRTRGRLQLAPLRAAHGMVGHCGVAGTALANRPDYETSEKKGVADV